MIGYGAVGLVERSLPTPEFSSLNPVTFSLLKCWNMILPDKRGRENLFTIIRGQNDGNYRKLFTKGYHHRHPL